ncbi:hypothetical protein F4778DRAFT_750352 [Xylariomycetidae sp. FL2044]|nr:hypothetical protein F4778DRAFT_750352 [Xylariomycetidae sp. FL2044]
MDTLLETGNRRHSRASRMSMVSTRPVIGITSPPIPSALPEATKPIISVAVPEEAERHVLVRVAEAVERRRRSRRVSLYRPHHPHHRRQARRPHNRPRRPQANDEDDEARIKRKENKRSLLYEPMPPAYDENAERDKQQQDIDLEAQRERVETRRFWILAVPTVITGLGTVLLCVFEIINMIAESREAAEESEGFGIGIEGGDRR